MMQTSLFDAPAQPVWHQATSWGLQLLTGSLAISLCVLAVALMGFFMLTGRLPIRRAGRVVAGCFLLLGSLGIAFALQDLGQSAGGRSAQSPSQQALASPLPPANFTR